MNDRTPTFTPGPWRVFDGDLVVAGNAQVAYPATLAFPDNPVGLDGPYSDEQREANARLIAAAPDLYAALQTAKHVMVNVDATVGDNWREYAAAIDAARAALARVNGEAIPSTTRESSAAADANR